MISAPRPPSRDWETDFDHLDDRWTSDPYPIWAALRSYCPVAHTNRFEGCYLPTTYAGARAVAYDTDSFSSRRFIVRDHKTPLVSAPPLTADPPAHKGFKRAALPLFAPEEVAKLEARTRAICHALIDAFPTTVGDVVELYTKHIPVKLTAHMMGLPEEDGHLFRRWLHEVLELAITEPSLAMRVAVEMDAYFTQKLRSFGRSRRKI